jgi:hypothetical protein
MDLGGANWWILDVVAPLLLAAVVIWAFLRNRAMRPRDVDRSEEATRTLYEEENRANRDDV